MFLRTSADNGLDSRPPATASARSSSRRGSMCRRPNGDLEASQRPSGDQAKSEMSRRDYDKALLTLTSARSVAPEEPEVYRLLERAYTRKGDRDSARGARERYQQLRGRTSGAAPN